MSEVLVFPAKLGLGRPTVLIQPTSFSAFHRAVFGEPTADTWQGGNGNDRVDFAVFVGREVIGPSSNSSDNFSRRNTLNFSFFRAYKARQGWRSHWAVDQVAISGQSPAVSTATGMLFQVTANQRAHVCV
jgi:hypothetical protein